MNLLQREKRHSGRATYKLTNRSTAAGFASGSTICEQVRRMTQGFTSELPKVSKSGRESCRICC